MLTVAERVPANFEKPYQVVRGLSSRLPWAWGGLCFATELGQANNAGLVDEVTGDIADSLTGVTYAYDEWRNPALVCIKASNTRVGWPVSPVHHRPSAALTVYARVKRIGTADFLGGMIVLLSSVTGYSFTMQEAEISPGHLEGAVSINGIEKVTAETATATPQDTYLNLFLRWRSGTTVTLDSLYDGGATQTAQVASGSATGTIDQDLSQRLFLCRSDVATDQWPGHYSQAMVWDRRLTDAEIRAIATDPFGWCSPRRETVGVSGTFLLGGQPLMQVGGRG